MQTIMAPSEVTTVATGMQRAETLSRLATLYDLITAIQDVVGPDHPNVSSVPTTRAGLPRLSLRFQSRTIVNTLRRSI